MRRNVASALVLVAFGSAPYIPVVHADALFGPKADFATGNSPYSLAIGDLNGDGKPDLVVADYGDYAEWRGAVAVLLGNGEGGFGTHTDFDITGFGINSVAIGDLNTDGKLDVVSTVHDFFGFGFDYGAIAVMLGNGDGTFEPPTYSLTGGKATSVAIGDMNSDGKPDVVVITTGYFGGGGGSVMLGNGDGTLGATAGFSTGGAAPRSVAIGDLNADGKPDLATANVTACQDVDGCPGSVSVLLGNGDGSLGAKTDYDPGDHYAVAIGDLNADGKPDLAVETNGAVSVLLGNGDGTFGAHADFGTGGFATPMAIADLNDDGKPDLVVGSDGAVAVLLGNGDGSFATKSDYVTGSSPLSVAIGDLNGDGKPDLATANTGANTVSVLLNIGLPSCPAAPMSFDLTPSTLNLRSMGHWVTGVLEPEPPASPADIDVASIRLNGSVPVDASAPASIGDADNDGRPDLTVKFDRAAVELTVAEGDAVGVTVSGGIGSGCFEATDVIRVSRAHVAAPSAVRANAASTPTPH